MNYVAPKKKAIKKHFSIRFKLLIIFGLLIVIVAIIEGTFAIRIAKQAVTEKIETHLKNKAEDTAEVLDGRINTMFQFLEGISRMPILRNIIIEFHLKKKYYCFLKKQTLTI